MKKTFLLPILLITILSLQLTGCKKEVERKDNYGKFTVTVMLDNDTVEGAEVRLYDEDGHLIETKTTNSQGKTVFNNLEPGKYELDCNYLDYRDYEIYEIKAGQNKKVILDLWGV